MRLAKKDNDTFPKEIQKSLILPGFKFSSFVLIETIEIELQNQARSSGRVHKEMYKPGPEGPRKKNN